VPRGNDFKSFKQIKLDCQRREKRKEGRKKTTLSKYGTWKRGNMIIEIAFINTNNEKL
jgi:hypothetical protein